jgi:heme-degrading monooxygenase HmoA
MIKRIWTGWTTRENSDAYERLLKEEVFPGIRAMEVPGYLAIELLRREVEEGVEFTTIMTFESMDAVRAFAGDDPERAYVPEKARRILSRFDERSRHLEVRHVGGPEDGSG